MSSLTMRLTEASSVTLGILGAIIGATIWLGIVVGATTSRIDSAESRLDRQADAIREHRELLREVNERSIRVESKLDILIEMGKSK